MSDLSQLAWKEPPFLSEAAIRDPGSVSSAQPSSRCPHFVAVVHSHSTRAEGRRRGGKEGRGRGGGEGRRGGGEERRRGRRGGEEEGEEEEEGRRGWVGITLELYSAA